MTNRRSAVCRHV